MTVSRLRGLAVAAALLVLGFGVLAAAGRGERPAAPPEPPAAPQKPPEAAKTIRGTVKDPAGKPVAGATVVAAVGDGSGERLTTTTDADGRFGFDRFPRDGNPRYATMVIAAKDGFAPTYGHSSPGYNEELTLTLPEAASYSGTVQDAAGRPIHGAEVQYAVVNRNDSYSSWAYMPANHIRGTVAGKLYLATTDATGAFRFNAAPAGAELFLRASAPGYGELDTAGLPRQHVVGPGAKPAAITLEREAVVRGRVTSKVPGVAVKDVTVRLSGREGAHNVNRIAKPDADGRFEFRSLRAAQYGVFLAPPKGAAATAAGASPTLKAGETADVALEVVAGSEVTGVVRVKGTGQPLAGASVAASGSFDPNGSELTPATTDAAGKFRLHLPPGEAQVFLRGVPAGYGLPSNNYAYRKVTVPADSKPVAVPEPFEAVKVVEGLKGRVTDAAGKLMPHVRVSALQHSSVCGNFAAEPVDTSTDAEFTLKYSPNGPLEPGRSVPLRVETTDGKRFEAAALVTKDGVATVRVPTLAGVEGPQEVKPDELAGLVVDEKGKPLAGVKIHVWDWVDHPENLTFTGPDGVFRLKDTGRDKHVQVRFKKDGYSPVMVIRQTVGVKGLVIAMDRATYFEGVVRGPDGKPAAGAVVRADQGPKVLDGGVYTHVWTETKSDARGKYRLYVQPDEYAVCVKAAGVGVARLPRTGIGHGQGRPFDVALEPGVTFRAKVVDSVAGNPAAGLRLYDWEQKEVDARSDAAGVVTITELLPGEFTFSVGSDRYARWWSEQSPREWERKAVDDPKTGWQRNFDGLTFDLRRGMDPVTIIAEPAVRVTGRVLDPDGQPVAGATVAPARTGSGNSLTGDTRFGVETQADGTFALTLPASGAAEYNLVAHDGKYREWRKWANGVLPPVRTTPGQAIDGVTLRLTRPAVVRGRVVDAKGRPVAGREVRAHAADRRENRYYDPTTTTGADGTFELKYVRPAEQWVQVAPFWLDGRAAPADSTRALTLKAGQVVENVTLVAAEEPPK